MIRDIAYRDLDTPLTGLLCRDETLPGSRPGILLVHGGAGLDEHAREQARRYADLGYVVLACDMFGDGVAGDRERVIRCLTALRDDPALMVRRAQAGLRALAACPGTDGRAAAIGFCFGGMAVLALARAGEPLAGAVSIHGSLATNRPARPGSVRARLLVCHGAQDPRVPLGDVTAFAEEMDDAGADWQLIMYGGALHGFTHAHATPGAVPGVGYDARADARSFADTRGFLAGLFAGGADGQDPDARALRNCATQPGPVLGLGPFLGLGRPGPGSTRYASHLATMPAGTMFH
jgi:dienelactone hydrolase